MSSPIHTIRNIGANKVEADFWNRYGSVGGIELATMYKLTPVAVWGGSANAVAFCSNSRDMTLPDHAGVTFRASPYLGETVIEKRLDEPSSMELNGVFDTNSFLEDEVLAGKWNFAEFEIFVVHFDWGSDDDDFLGEWVVHSGFLGEFVSEETAFRSESRGPLSRLENEIQENFVDLCNVPFRGTKCGHTATTVDIDAVTYNVTQSALVVDTVTDQYNLKFTKLAGTDNSPPTDFFKHGKITAVSGVNGSLSREMKGSVTGSTIDIALKRRFPFDVEAGQTFNLVAGCDHTLTDCMKFERVADRRAFDWVPTPEEALRIPPAT